MNKNFIDKDNILMINTDKEIKSKVLKEEKNIEFLKIDGIIEFENKKEIVIKVKYLKEVINQLDNEDKIKLVIGGGSTPLYLESLKLRGIIARIIARIN